MLTKDTAICIRSIDYSETSQIVTFFTRAHGKVSVIAKGSKRPKSSFDGPIELLLHGEVVFSDSSREKLATLTEFEQQRGLDSSRTNLVVLNCSGFAAELVMNLTDEYDPHPQLFDNFLQFLKDVRNTGGEARDAISLLILFQLNLLKEIGLQLFLSACSNCKNKYSANWYQVYFSHSASGLICRDCEASFPHRIRISKACANILTNLKTPPEANEKTVRETEELLISHFTELLHRKPRMAKYIL